MDAETRERVQTGLADLARTDAGQFWLVTFDKLLQSGAELSPLQAGALVELLEFVQGSDGENVRRMISATCSESVFADDMAEA